MATRAAGFVIYRYACNEIQFLLLKASYGSYHWSSPKGHVDPGEDEFTTALRETKEEAGYGENDLLIYKDNPITLRYDANGKPKEVIYWLAELKDPCKQPTLSREHTELKWLNKDDAKKIVEYKDNQEMIEQFYNFIIKVKMK